MRARRKFRAGFRKFLCLIPLIQLGTGRVFVPGVEAFLQTIGFADDPREGNLPQFKQFVREHERADCSIMCCGWWAAGGR